MDTVLIVSCQLCFVVVQGAGGMQMIDPLFQRTLVSECRAHRIPVIFDEVFTGFWRLGREVSYSFSNCIYTSKSIVAFKLFYRCLLVLQSAAELLGCSPDVACFAKLMTGGVLPLAVTLTTEAVFEVFKGGSKVFYRPRIKYAFFNKFSLWPYLSLVCIHSND